MYKFAMAPFDGQHHSLLKPYLSILRFFASSHRFPTIKYYMISRNFVTLKL